MIKLGLWEFERVFGVTPDGLKVYISIVIVVLLDEWMMMKWILLLQSVIGHHMPVYVRITCSQRVSAVYSM